jgi:hypothetical protein
MDVSGWLRSLGLEQYEANFRDNEVDAAVLTRALMKTAAFVVERDGAIVGFASGGG